MIIKKLKEKEEIFNDSKEPTKMKLRKRINTLELENEVLKNAIKDELYKIFMKKLAEPEEAKRYKEENIRLRKQIKVLKQIIKEEQNQQLIVLNTHDFELEDYLKDEKR